MPGASPSDDDPINLVVEEYRALRAEVDRRRKRCATLRQLLDHLEGQTARDEHALRELEAVMDISPQLRIEHLDKRLRGKRLQEVALEMLRDQAGPGVPIHYRAWYELVVSAGHAVGGKDPLATFLAQVHRSDEVESLGGRSGLYQLRAVA